VAKELEHVMPYDPNERRREQNAIHDQDYDRKALAAEREKQSETVKVSALTRDPWIANWEFGVAPTDPNGDSKGAAQPQTAREQFLAHSRLLIRHLNSLWDGTFPVQLIKQWREQIDLLDIEKTAQSLEIALALRDSYLQAIAQYTPANTEMSWGMRFATQVPRIGNEIQWVIDFLRHVTASDRAR
jgi:hypothetical protein